VRKGKGQVYSTVRDLQFTARFNESESSRSLISLRGTVPGKNGENVGVLIASPSPIRNISIKRINGEIKPAMVTMARVSAITNIHLWLIIRSLRRSTISVSAPVGRAKAVIERLSEAHVSATIREDATSEVISHDSPTASIKLPIFDAIAASHMALNALYFNGIILKKSHYCYYYYSYH